jgi:DNA-binding transcriptional MerR regulator
MCYNVCMSETLYSPKRFGQMIGRSVKTLQKWDREGTFTAKRTPTNRRYYTHDDYLAYLKGESNVTLQENQARRE